MRSLNIIPIVHTVHDLGFMADRVQALKEEILTKRGAEASRQLVDHFWSELRQGIEGWDLEFSNVRVFQDALPVDERGNSGIETRIVRELAAKGSPNHQLIQWLCERGATLVGTESPKLLLEEYELIKLGIEHRSAEEQDRIEMARRRNSVLERRDRFIADRIDATLAEGDVGIIFLGMFHRLHEHLSPNIEVAFPFGKPADSIATSSTLI